MKKTAVVLLILFLSACLPIVPSTSQETATFVPSGPTPTVDPVEEMRQQANIKLDDDGKTFTFTVTSRFMVFLEDQNFPVEELICSPNGIIGKVSNGSLRGPNLYPVMFEGVQAGQCTLSDRDFSVKIIIQ